MTTPKERGVADLIELTPEEQQELLAGCRAWLHLGQKFGSELPLKAMFQIAVEQYPGLAAVSEVIQKLSGQGSG